MKLIVYPNPILTKISEPVTEFDDFGKNDLRDLCEELHTIMIKNSGAGLSAVQVGILKRIVVMQWPNGHKFTFINPEIVDHKEETFTFSEGCLSVPGYFEDRERFKHILLKYQSVEGETYERPFTEIEAFCIQHELDHLEGKLFIDDLSPLKKDRVRVKIKKTLRSMG